MEGLPGAGHFGCRCDVTLVADCLRLAEDVKARYGGLDALVNSVGISRSHPLLESEFELWKQPLEVMLDGAVRVVRALAPLLRDGGRIVHITSIHESRVAPGSSAYGMAKAAVTQLVRALALELAPRGILSNAVAPGFIDTPMSIKANGLNELDSEWFKTTYVEGGRLPLRRAGRPEEIAGIVWFLAGPDASYITGSVITADGGLVLTF